MKRTFTFLLLTCCMLNACRSRSQAVTVTTAQHYNLVMVPDLSNRLLRNAGLPDVGIVGAVLNSIYPKIANYRRSMNQKDRYRVVLTSKKLGMIHRADFDRMAVYLDTFADQGKRIAYLKGSNKINNLPKATTAFVTEFSRIEAAASRQTDGADLWSFFASGIDANLVCSTTSITHGNKVQCNQYHNVLVIFTDGYIEAGISGAQGCEGNQCRYLSQQLIEKFRKAYQKRPDKNESLQAFFIRNHYGIMPVNNPYLKSFDVLLLEADDRSLSATGNATKFPADYEIMQLFWTDWMKRSGVQRFEMHPVARDANEAVQNVLTFMGVK